MNQEELENNENDSLGSTPKSEGGLQQSPVHNEKDARFVIIEKEQVKEELELKKPHVGSSNKTKEKEINLTNKKNPTQNKGNAYESSI